MTSLKAITINQSLYYLILAKLLLSQNNILYENQFGFRQNLSTTHALKETTKKIKQACDTEHYACGVFLNLQIPFYTVNHSILFQKT